MSREDNHYPTNQFEKPERSRSLDFYVHSEGFLTAIIDEPMAAE